jgi:NAD(P)-dependent dehydrogenase (short-subunit alcohol dehydrogenase family)
VDPPWVRRSIQLTPPSVVHCIFNVNVVGPMRVTHAAVRLLRRSTTARIVNVTSIAVPLRLDGEAVYAASKAAIKSFTRTVVKELGPTRITCNAVGPSVIPTRLTEGENAFIDAAPAWSIRTSSPPCADRIAANIPLTTSSSPTSTTWCV